MLESALKSQARGENAFTQHIRICDMYSQAATPGASGDLPMKMYDMDRRAAACDGYSVRNYRHFDKITGTNQRSLERVATRP